jgi:tripartite-type tricarboxylate transporter receptor subunit TctC
MALSAALFAALFAATGLSPASAQDWPPKTVTLVVGFAAGGATDGAARIIARKLQENIGRTVVVENRAGAGGNLAHQYVARAAPDGSVILLGSIGPLAIAPHLMNVGYEPQKDLAPLTMGVTFPNVLVVNPTVGVKTLAEFVAKAKAKARPGSIDYASTGNGSASHLAGELLNQRAGIETVHIPYKGGAPVCRTCSVAGWRPTTRRRRPRRRTSRPAS